MVWTILSDPESRSQQPFKDERIPNLGFWDGLFKKGKGANIREDFYLGRLCKGCRLPRSVAGHSLNPYRGFVADAFTLEP